MPNFVLLGLRRCINQTHTPDKEKNRTTKNACPQTAQQVFKNRHLHACALHKTRVAVTYGVKGRTSSNLVVQIYLSPTRCATQNDKANNQRPVLSQ